MIESECSHWDRFNQRLDLFKENVDLDLLLTF